MSPMQPLLYGYLPILVFLVIAGGDRGRDVGRFAARRPSKTLRGEAVRL